MDDPSLSDFVARPGQSLDTHLSSVSSVGQMLVEDAGTTPYGDEWEDVIETLSWVHDIGKLTEYFQTYIETNDRTTAESVELTYHGTFGGLVAVLALGERGMSAETTAAGFYAVAKHHSVLRNAPTDFGNFYLDKRQVDDRYERSKQQLQNVDETANEAADRILLRATDGAYSWDELVDDGFDRARKLIKQLKPLIDDDEWYGCTLRAWSTLVTADKADASGLTRTEWLQLDTVDRPNVEKLTDELRNLADTPLPDGETAAAYLDTPWKPLPGPDADLDQRLAALRTAANSRVTSTLQEQHRGGERVFELTLPTGFGKTYTGLRAALKLADERDSRVIYALPYTSIIDQVDEQIREVFDVSPRDNSYTKHHHLADTRTSLQKGSDDVDAPGTGEETLHAEAWRTGLVLTTFTQLFESAAGPGNVQSTKLPALQDSVILVDEPQALSLDWWGLVGRLATYLRTEYDATIVFMTATQPRMLERQPSAPTPRSLTGLKDECTDLIADLPRVKFDLHESLVDHLDESGAEPLPIASAATEIRETNVGDRDALAVVNTVSCTVNLVETLSTSSTINLADELISYHRDKDGEEFDPAEYLDRLAASTPSYDELIASLTTRIRPADRQALLESLTLILDPNTETPFDSVPTVTVSTQLIEAGVDLSFDRLYRDYAPLPAIVQAAGRCNRRFGGEPATVTVWRMDSPEEDSYIPSTLIYGDRSLLRPTHESLEMLRDSAENDVIPESTAISKGIEQFYDSLHEQRRTETRADNLVNAFDTAQGEILRNASVISSDYPTQEFLVLVGDSDFEEYELYERCKRRGDWRLARQSFQALKRTLVSVPVSESPTEENPVVVRVPSSPSTYDLESGRGVTEESIRDDLEV